MNALADPLSHSHKQPEYRPDIDGLRAVAVLLVIGFHAVPENLSGGFIGVDIFFVISGYLITQIIFRQIRDANFSLIDFYAKRVRRIFPALIVVLTATLTAGWFLLPVTEFKSLGLNIAGSAAFAQNLVLLHEVGYFDIAAIKKPLLHIWSLGIEEQYYIVWPLLLLVIHRFRLNVLFICALLSGLSLAVCIYYMRQHVDRGFYLPTSRAWELMAGSALAVITDAYLQITRLERWKEQLNLILNSVIYRAGEMRSRTLVNFATLVAFLLIAFAAMRFSPSLRFPGYYALLPVIAAMILIASSKSVLNQRFLASKVLASIGLISYPLYLWHFPIFAFGHTLAPDGLSPLQTAIAISLSFGLAWLTYVCVEKPLRFGPARKFVVLPSLLLMLTIFIGGTMVYKADGVPGRLPKALQKFLLTGEETMKFWRSGECLLGPNQGWEKFGSACAGSGRKPLLLLWGDSYAAAQYPGFKLFGDIHGFEVAEFTSSSCPPAIGFRPLDRPFCKNINDFVLKKIKELRPDLVILHATWYGPKNFENGVRETVKELRALSINFVILGPVPGWGGAGKGLSENVQDYYFEHGRTLIPERTTYRLNDTGQDQEMRELANRFGARYVSARNVLCNANGCLARIGPDGGNLTAFDGGHMTVQGSIYLVGHALPEILQDIR